MSDFSNLINSNTLVLVDMFATWCGPCQTLSPVLKEVKSHFNDDLKIIKVDVDKNLAVAQKFEVRGVPTLILFKQGKILWRQSGLMTKSELTEIITRHIKS